MIQIQIALLLYFEKFLYSLNYTLNRMILQIKNYTSYHDFFILYPLINKYVLQFYKGDAVYWRDIFDNRNIYYQIGSYYHYYHRMTGLDCNNVAQTQFCLRCSQLLFDFIGNHIIFRNKVSL